MCELKGLNNWNSVLKSELKESELSISDFDETGEIPEQSDSSLTRVVRNKNSYRLFKLKSINKPLSQDSMSLVESLDLARSMSHPSMIQVCQKFEDSQAVHFLLEYIPSHSLYLEILMSESISDEEALTYLDQIKNVLGYLHSQNLFLRSLNPEKIFVQENKKIVLTESIFTQELSIYTPPEGWGSKEADFWAVGLLMFEITQGFTPFEHPVSKYSVQFELKFNKPICSKLKEFIISSLKINPRKRILRQQERDLVSYNIRNLTTEEVWKKKTICKLERYLNSKKNRTKRSSDRNLTAVPILEVRSTRTTEEVVLKNDRGSQLKFDDDDLASMLSEYRTIEQKPVECQNKGLFNWITRLF